MSASFTISAQRLAANKQNAQHSTGPKTENGKANSSRNASTHNIYSTYLLQEGESEDLFISFRNLLINDLNPQSFLELAQADRIISIHWKLRRVQSAEYYLNQSLNISFQFNFKKQQEKRGERRDRFIENCNKFNIPVTDEALAEQGLAEPDPNAPALEPDPGYFLAQSLQSAHEKGTRTTPFERLLTAESKLQSLLSRAMKDYRQLQKDRQYQDEQQDEEDPRQPFCPCVTPTQTEDEIQDEEEPSEDDEQLTTDNEPLTPARLNVPQSASKKIEPTCQNDSHPSISPPNSFGESEGVEMTPT